MKVSVVVCTYDMDHYDDVRDAADSVLAQTHEETELVLVSDGAPDVRDAMSRDYGDRDDVVVGMTDENAGVSRSRNLGAELSTGEIVAFVDDDGVAEPDWVEELLGGYERHDAVAVGGRMTPEWVAGEPSFLPEEYYWLIGVTHRGYPREECRVRNTWGSNFSVRRDVFEELGGFDEDLGRIADKQVQGEEPEFGARLYAEYGERMVYVPSARVAHKIFDYRTDREWLLRRAFWQGYSKFVMDRLLDDSGGEEDTYLRQLLAESLPSRIATLLRRPSRDRADQLVMLLLFTAAVGLGYGYGIGRAVALGDASPRR
ncbi:glucosyl-dolichyl phosphate glucuronosyltransferase [Halobaculum lipolyticum]|uniref:Glucosyl-dolichyl phosphate glucuronosyltransferase n=1 Tax=Halobaculum lipolyticum TaxID=3032001 RepID=A0ABD5W7U6_9EURY|nr:glucosyl-dolichyl phosphate glucuronosyltransferase [Halobaculum sp. DT31]